MQTASRHSSFILDSGVQGRGGMSPSDAVDGSSTGT
jgi:hypothetical protein